MVALSLLPLLLASMTLAVPSQPLQKRGFQGSCPVPASAFSLPATLAPIQSAPIFTTVGMGKQNYTCSAAGNYTSTGAVAQLFDVSCLFGHEEFSTIQDDIFSLWDSCPSTDPTDPELARKLKKHWNISPVGQHYFVKNNGTLVPVFDFTSTGDLKGNPGAIFFGKKIGDIPSPDGSDNVDWLELQEVSGELANDVYRVNTVKGQPPASCKPGSADISVKYTAKYVFVN
ncbi:hypothetical protein BJV77DRAFT_1067556 [Russula vinacea]|nr:hypothetical protein BJV77DRAFT_1067556 [Russula vinacea]